MDPALIGGIVVNYRDILEDVPPPADGTVRGTSGADRTRPVVVVPGRVTAPGRTSARPRLTARRTG